MSQPATATADIGKIIEAVRQTVKAEPYCFLITVDGLTQPHARMLEATRIEPDFRVWMISSPTSRKVQELRGNSRATMAFADSRGEGYVTLVGNAKIVNDSTMKKSIWKFEYGAFFPGGPDGADSVLIEFNPQRIEIMHFHLKIGVWPWTMKPLVLVRKGDEWTVHNQE
jgi:general stress protein 26